MNEKNNKNASSKIDELCKVDSSVIKKMNQKQKLEEIIKIIEKNPDILEKLDIPKLKIINKYYKDKILEYEKKLSN